MKLFSTELSDSRPWFLSLIDQLRDLRGQRNNPPPPALITATPIDVPEMWSPQKAALPRALSLLLHITIVATALAPWATAPKRLPKGLVTVDIVPHRLFLPVSNKNGGGGGGKHEHTPPSLGKRPRAANEQFVPPDPEPAKNLDPTLIVEPTIVAPQLALLPQLTLLNIGDPEGISGPSSSGPGKGSGIGTGDGRGIGADKGPGIGTGENGGIGGEIFHPGGGISSPVLMTEVLPQYSEEARKARFQGRVLLDTIVLEDGSVRVVRVARGIGFGLDESAIAAVLQWKFKPARRNGKPVAVALNVEVSFNLR